MPDELLDINTLSNEVQKLHETIKRLNNRCEKLERRCRDYEDEIYQIKRSPGLLPSCGPDRDSHGTPWLHGL